VAAKLTAIAEVHANAGRVAAERGVTIAMGTDISVLADPQHVTGVWTGGRRVKG
jgi:imidazolonepropionase-like amidohydrolase